MNIISLKLKNYKGFKTLNIDFDPKLNVIVGINGAGKTSILEAIIKNIYSFTGIIVQDPQFNSKYQYSDNEINHQATNSIIDLEMIFNNEPLKILNKIGELLPPEIDTFNEFDDIIISKVKAFRKSIASRQYDIPVIKYYPSDRNSGESGNIINASNRVFLSAQLETWSNIYHNSFAQDALMQWFFEMENKELRSQKENRDFDSNNPILEPIRTAISKAFNLLNGKDYLVSSDQIQRAGNNTFYNTIVLKESSTGVKEYFHQKSDGEKSIITLVADITYNLIISKYKAQNDVFASGGLVIIDEIDAHLHPTWQRKVVPMLTSMFPNIQFIITTHSPQVVSSVSSENLFVLSNGTIHKVHHRTKGIDTNTILKLVLDSGERPEEYITLIEKLDAAMENHEPLSAIEALISEIENLGSEDYGGNNPLIDDLKLQLESYKFELAYEAN